MPSPLDTVLSGLSDGLAVVVGAVALVSRPPEGVASWWMEVTRETQALYTDLRVYKALFELRLSNSALVDRAPPPLEHFSEALSACNDALRSVAAQLSSAYSSDVLSSPGTSFSPLCGNQEGGSSLTTNLIKRRTELGHSFILMWLDSLPKSSLLHAVATQLPPSPINDIDPSIMQSDTSPIPHSKPSRGLFQTPPLSVGAQSLETSLSAALTTAEDVGKQWVRQMGIEVDETNRLLPHLPLILGSLFCVILEDEAASPASITPSLVSLRSLICHTLLGISESTTPIALLGTGGSGKSLLIDSLIGFQLLVPGEPTVLPCRIQHIRGLSTPKLNVVTEPFTFAVDELRRLRFAARCSEWNADRTTRTLGRPDADAPFRELWQAWLMMDSGLYPLMETIDQSGLEFHPVTTGYEAVRETLLNLERVIRLCGAFNILIPFDILEWPVLQVEFKPLRDHPLAQSWEILNLPGIHFVATTEDLSLMDRLMQRGSTIVPVLNMAEQLSNLKWKRWPKKLNELHIPIPFVIGPFLDVTKHDDPDGQEFAKEVAEKTWTTTADSENPKTQRGSLMDRVLPCSLEHGFSARYLLDSLSPESTQGMPSWHTVWADINDPTLSCLREIFGPKGEEQYNGISTARLDKYLWKYFSDSKLDVVIGAIAQVASESPAEKGAKQLKYLKDKLISIGQELDQFLVQAPSLPSTPPELSVGRVSAADIEQIIHNRMDDLRARTEDAVNAALHSALDEMKGKWPPGGSKHPTIPNFLEDSAEYIIPISALNTFLELAMSHLQATLPKLAPAWFEDVTAAVALTVPNHGINVKSLDAASLADATSRLATRLQDISTNSREFTAFQTSRSQASERTRFDSAHNPFDAISRLMWAFLRRMWWLLWPQRARHRIPSEHATGVCMRVLGESWLLDLEKVALTHVAPAGEETVPGGIRIPEKGLSEVFAIRYGIAATLAALQ